jgi:predicted RNase H-like HicB family nuclease
MVIEWDAEDDIYVVRVPELPGCVSHGKTYEEAVRQGQDAIESWIEAARAWGSNGDSTTDIFFILLHTGNEHPLHITSRVGARRGRGKQALQERI